MLADDTATLTQIATIAARASTPLRRSMGRPGSNVPYPPRRLLEHAESEQHCCVRDHVSGVDQHEMYPHHPVQRLRFAIARPRARPQ